MHTMRHRLLTASCALLLLGPASNGLGATNPGSGGGATAPTGATGPSGPTGPTGPTGPPTLFRPVGCVARGLGHAYLHGPARKVVAIGFDDGPARDTAGFVRMLERAHVPATFFTIGEQVTPAYRTLLLRELRDGDELGDHSYTHPFLTRVGGVRSQLSRTLSATRALTGFTPCLFRPPYGDYNRGVVSTAASLGLATVVWDVDPSDYRLPGSAAITQRVLSGVRPGSIILSHDGGGPRSQTLAAYPAIIAGLRARGYRIETISQLLGFRPLYARCSKTCAGLGVARERVPANALIR